MMKRYGILLAITVIVGVAASLMARVPRATRSAAPESAAAVAALPASVEVFPDRVVASPDSIVAGSEVELRVSNRTVRPIEVRLAGYEDVFSVTNLAPDSARIVRFRADRPGDQFAWLVDGEPKGRLDIKGSHLVEGHR